MFTVEYSPTSKLFKVRDFEKVLEENQRLAMTNGANDYLLLMVLGDPDEAEDFIVRFQNMVNGSRINSVITVYDGYLEKLT